jgi:sterol desaturase/sphingolipid hydroxylase (fatty acid hydroxylase superfamily)
VDALVFNSVNALGLSLLLVLELRSSTFQRVLRDRRRMRRNVAFLFTSLGVGALLMHSASWLDVTLPKLHWTSSLWLQVPAVFALGELLNWSLHFAKHQTEFLWRIHCPHHKEDHYSVWLTVHTWAPETLFSGTLINATALMLGCDLLALEIYLLFYSLINTYQHSALPHSLGWLDRWIVSPAYHRHHHGGAQVNFGSTLTVFDRLFGTAKFPRDRYEAVDPPRIDQTPEPFGYVEEMLYPVRPSRWVKSVGNIPPSQLGNAARIEAGS